jgi:hypothetical protein
MGELERNGKKKEKMYGSNERKNDSNEKKPKLEGKWAK